METQLDGQNVWYYLGIAGTIISQWGLPQQSTELTVLAITSIIIGMTGGLKPIFTTIYDFLRINYRRLPPVERKLALVTVPLALPSIG